MVHQHFLRSILNDFTCQTGQGSTAQHCRRRQAWRRVSQRAGVSRQAHTETTSTKIQFWASQWLEQKGTYTFNHGNSISHTFHKWLSVLVWQECVFPWSTLGGGTQGCLQEMQCCALSSLSTAYSPRALKQVAVLLRGGARQIGEVLGHRLMGIFVQR